ncbi:hypothetical protein FQR65_LT00322 [Abscondita terminalis]|nr:hypothetical protein FQR65_LT00322 [Abscondita terminalis]
MSGTFIGFSEEDIKYLSNEPNSHVNKEIPKALKPGLQKKLSSRNRIEKQTMEGNRKILDKEIANLEIGSNSENTDSLHTTVVTDRTQQNDTNDSTTNKEIEENKDIIVENTSSSSVSVETENAIDTIGKRIDLVQFQKRQKLIEEQNKRRKELLGKALAERTQRTKEEALKLEEIRKEFKRLDLLFSNDVNILRQQIEVASLEYMEAEKRYFKIESEFLHAKLSMHHKLEKKEMLTEHLCTVIEKNEERKAEKLEELLNKLNLNPPED